MNKDYKVIYQIFVRNYSLEGTFKSVEMDLDRIEDLGVDIIYLTPIHEIGVLQRKGSYGSPYAIKDYFSISKDLGTLDDFISLVNKIHEKGMKIILDMVFNHTSPDNVLVNSHPEYYFYRDGKRCNRVGDWSDIIDLDTLRDDTQEYLVSVLSYWRKLGVDGFRFDVASTIPLSFYKRARKALGKEVIFFGESVDRRFASYLKSVNAIYVDDKSLMEVMDYLYNYHYLDDLIRYFNKEESLKDVIDCIKNDDSNIVRVNCLENHDKDRFASYFTDLKKMKEWINFIYSLPGHAFIYMGQEYGIKHKPELFEKDPVIWLKNEEIFSYYKLLNEKKHKQNMAKSNIFIKEGIVHFNGDKYHL